MIASAALSKAQSYIDDVLDERIATCKLVRGAVQRHVDDLERESTANFPYHFDKTAAEVACEFYPLMLRHSIGDFAGLPFELEPWQAFSMACIFGWKRDDDNSRRFRKVYWSMARKNGKSTIVAGMALYLAMMDINPLTRKPEDVAQIILAATKKEQADKVIYAEIERMRNQSPHIKQRSTPINRQISFHHNSGTIRCVGSDKAYDGLNPSAVILDELHEFKHTHAPFLDTMRTGFGARRQPIIAMVTTAGSDRSHIWKEEYRYASGVASGEFRDDQYYGICYELDEGDDPLDEANWIKSNPNLGISVSIDFLRQEALPAATSDIALRRFTRYFGNRIVSATSRAFDVEKWDACQGTLSDWHDADAIGGGVDLGGRDDLAAWALVARFPVDTEAEEPIWRYEIKSRSYIAQDSKRDITAQPFAEWVHRDLLKVCKYPISDLKSDLIEECFEHGVSDIAYDPYNGQQFAEDVSQEGIVIARMPQNYAYFNEPIKDFLQAIEDGRVMHDGNPLLRWCIGNAVLVADRQDKVMFDKRESSEKIDPVVAMLMAYWRAMCSPGRVSGPLFVTGE